jgi:hypothetical protein
MSTNVNYDEWVNLLIYEWGGYSHSDAKLTSGQNRLWENRDKNDMFTSPADNKKKSKSLVSQRLSSP